MACPTNSVRYNSSLCACAPGYIFNGTANNCTLFTADYTIFTDGGVEYYAFSFPETIFSFDSIKKFTQSQAVFLEATLIMLLTWLGFCLFMRLMKVGDGRNIWFQVRWWISRLDISFATRHWLDDQKVVVKRKTELGGTFSIASWILFIGLFAASLYQIISKRSIEVHNVRATNAPDLASFINEIEFNITTLSSMSCLNLRGLETVVTGNPGFIDHRVSPLSKFVNYSCHNTSKGPSVTLQCNKCRLTQDNMYISWQFVDHPYNPATAVGFEFNLTAKNPANKKHLSFVSGTLKNGSTFDDTPVTFRGTDSNILKFNLFPQIYHNIHDLRLMQPLLHEFIPGSSFHEASQLQASLESSTDGLINTTLYINFLSAYIVEIDNRSIMGPVSFLADLGGLYCISIGIFFYFLVQCEYRIKRLRTEDSVLRKIRNRRKAQERWDKLRKYVMYTWGCSILSDDNTTAMGSNCTGFMTHSVNRNGSLHGSGLLHKSSQQKRQDSLSFNKKVSLPIVKNKVPEYTSTQRVKTCSAGMATDPEEKSRNELSLQHEVLGSTCDGKQNHVLSCEGISSFPRAFSLTAEDVIPQPPSLELEAGSKLDISDIQKNLQSLYEYNVMLREKLVATHSLLHELANKSSSPRIPDHA